MFSNIIFQEKQREQLHI